MKNWLLTLTAAALLAAPSLAAEAMQAKPADPAMQAEDMKGMDMPEHTMIAPGDIKWMPAPPVLPPGSKIAVLKGDPSKETMFVMRAWLPAGYQIPPHWHPSFENVTVISGEANFGMGDTFDKSKGHKLPVGGFASLAPQMHHYFWVEQETVIQLNGLGPQQFYYVNPADDPRIKK